MDDRHIRAKKEYKAGKSLAEIAAELGISPATIRSWKYREKWGCSIETQRNVAKERCNKRNAEKQMAASVEKNEELTDAQKAFCLHYVKTFNATMSYKRAYGAKYSVANTEGPKLLVNPRVRAEITRLKAIKAEAILAGPEDVVEKYMNIAFADITDYVEFGRATVPVMSMYGPVKVEDPETGNMKPLTKEINEVRLKESSEVDGTILTEVKQGKDGASVKMADRMRALDFLKDYFELNPNDRHKQEYDKKRLEIEMLKVQSTTGESNDGAVQILDDIPNEEPDNDKP